MFCKMCGREISDDAVCCIYCGRVVGAEAQQTIAQVESTGVKKESKTLKIMLSIVLSIVIFLVGFLSLTIITVRESLSGNAIENICSDIDAEVIAKDSSFVEMVDSFASSPINANKRYLERFIEKSTFFDAVESIANEYAEYLLNGKKPNGITNDDFVDFIYDNEDVIRDELWYTVTSADYIEYRNMNNEEVFEVFSEDADTPEGLEIAKNVMSKTTVSILIAVVVILAALLFIVRKKKLDTLMWLGVTVCLVAFVFGISWMVGNMLIGSIDNDLTKEIISVYADNSSGLVIKNVVISAIFGAVFIMIKSLLKKEKK